MATALTRAEPKSGYVVGVTCPGCGAEIELQHDFWVTSCDHCGSILRVLMPAQPPAFYIRPKIPASQARAILDRYLKENDLPLTESHTQIKQVFCPYWKIDALSIRVRIGRTETHEYDPINSDHEHETGFAEQRTVAISPYSVAVTARDQDALFPAVLGMRAQYLKMFPFEPEELPSGYQSLPVTREWEKALVQVQASANVIGQLGGESPGRNQTHIVNPRASILFFPYMHITSAGKTKMSAVIDALTGQVEAHSSQDEPSPIVDTMSSLPALGTVGLEFHRCTNCGADLPVAPSFVYLCANCGMLTFLQPVPRVSIASVTHNKPDLLVPFWKFKTSASDTYQIIPAFRIANAEALVRLSRRMTGALPHLPQQSPPTAGDNISAVTIDQVEATALGDIVRYREALDKSDTARFDFSQVSDTSLLLVPFRPEEYFYVDCALGAVTFERALLR